MVHMIIGACIIILSCLGFSYSVWHLISMLKTPKDIRLWWGPDVLIQLAYPIYILGVLIGIYQFMI
jgi:hypothetical protein